MRDWISEVRESSEPVSWARLPFSWPRSSPLAARSWRVPAAPVMSWWRPAPSPFRSWARLATRLPTACGLSELSVLARSLRTWSVETGSVVRDSGMTALGASRGPPAYPGDRSMSGWPSSVGDSKEAIAVAGTARAWSTAMPTTTASPTLRTLVTVPTFTPSRLTAAPGNSPGVLAKTAVTGTVAVPPETSNPTTAATTRAASSRIGHNPRRGAAGHAPEAGQPDGPDTGAGGVIAFARRGH